jgi:hypothetical protein
MAFAAGYWFRWWTARAAPSPAVPVATVAQEWAEGDYAGVPVAYHVRPA